MNFERWLSKNTSSLSGKTVAITGSTGGLGKELCRFIAALGAELILVDRSKARSEAFRDELIADFGARVRCIGADLEDMDSVYSATERLISEPIDVFIHNAGAYSIPRKICKTGYDNVFQINFISPYYIIKSLLPKLRERRGRAVVVGSIAHSYSKTDPGDIDFKTRKRASLVYGNAKRYLMYALHELFKNETEAALAVTHPGISFTGITAHYPKLIFALIKHPMKIIFMKPKKACLSILKGIYASTPAYSWIGPRFFGVWGLPRIFSLRSAKDAEIERIFVAAESIYCGIRK